MPIITNSGRKGTECMAMNVKKKRKVRNEGSADQNKDELYRLYRGIAVMKDFF